MGESLNETKLLIKLTISSEIPHIIHTMLVTMANTIAPHEFNQPYLSEDEDRTWHLLPLIIEFYDVAVSDTWGIELGGSLFKFSCTVLMDSNICTWAIQGFCAVSPTKTLPKDTFMPVHSLCYNVRFRLLE